MFIAGANCRGRGELRLLTLTGRFLEGVSSTGAEFEGLLETVPVELVSEAKVGLMGAIKGGSPPAAALPSEVCCILFESARRPVEIERVKREGIPGFQFSIFDPQTTDRLSMNNPSEIPGGS